MGWEGSERGKKALGFFHMTSDHGSFFSNGPSRMGKCQELGWLCWMSVGELWWDSGDHRGLAWSFPLCCLTGQCGALWGCLMGYAPCEELKLAIQWVLTLPNQQYEVQLCLHGVICVLCTAAESGCLWRGQDREMWEFLGGTQTFISLC